MNADASHLFRRAGFGALAHELDRFGSEPWPDLVDLVLDTDRVPASPPPPADLDNSSEGHLREHRMLHYWLDTARRPVDQAPVVEKVTLFLTGLLTSSIDKTADPAGSMRLNQLFRTKGLGDYRHVLHEASVNTATLRYLDNHHNVAGHPNENFARELLELFTLGPGDYSQADVSEAARAWTGYRLDDGTPRRHQFDRARHDQGTKRILGATGAFNGPDVIDLILDRRRHDHTLFMCQKLWSFFAYPVALTAREVADIAPTYAKDLNIRETLRAIFLHPQFRSARARWAVVRSPIEYLVAAMRHTGTDCDVLRPEWWCGRMGQNPFRPPNVDGWGQNEYWLNSTCSLARISVASRLQLQLIKRGDLEDVADLAPTRAADRALANCQLGPISPSSRQFLIDYVEDVRGSKAARGERGGLLQLPLLLPELVMG